MTRCMDVLGGGGFKVKDVYTNFIILVNDVLSTGPYLRIIFQLNGGLVLGRGRRIY